jgi:hypothetical protein
MEGETDISKALDGVICSCATSYNQDAFVCRVRGNTLGGSPRSILGGMFWICRDVNLAVFDCDWKLVQSSRGRRILCSIY